MKFGICCGPTSMGSEGEALGSAIARLTSAMTQAGADYLEFPVAVVGPGGDKSKFELLRESLAASRGLQIEVWNSFLPAHHKVVGPEVDLGAVLGYCRSALLRCSQLGGKVVVLGSAGARRVPDRFEMKDAQNQFIQFCRELNPIAEEASIDIAIEPLNKTEDNFLLNVEEGAKLVDKIKASRIRLLADLYHMEEEGESMQSVANAGTRLAHVHVADNGRVAPGYASDGEADFTGFFRALHAANYNARCSFEGQFQDIAMQAKPVLDLMRQRWQDAA